MKALVLGLILAAGCSQQTLLDGLSEPDANDLKAQLARGGISGEKVASGAGLFAVEVPAGGFQAAWRLARRGGFPRTAYRDKARLVMGPTEAKAEARRQRRRQLERQIGLHDDITAVAVTVGPHGAAVTARHRYEQAPDRRIFEKMVRATMGGEAEFKVEIALVEDPPDVAHVPADGALKHWVGVGASLFALIFLVTFLHSRKQLAT